MREPRTISENMRLALRDDVAHQCLGEGHETVVLSLASGYLYTCNDTARRFLELLDGRRTIAEIAALLEGEYEAERQRLVDDLIALARGLLDENLVALVEGES